MRRIIATFMCLALILTGLPITAIAQGTTTPVITVNTVLPDNSGIIEINNAISVDGKTNQYTVHKIGDEVDIKIERSPGYEIDSILIGTDTYSDDSDFQGAVTGSAITLIRNFSREGIDIAYKMTEDITVSATFRVAKDSPGFGSSHAPSVSPYIVTIAENRDVTVTTGSAITINNTSFTTDQEEVTYYLEPAAGRMIMEIRCEFEDGFEMIAMTSYDTDTKKICTTVRESSNYTLRVFTAPISLDMIYFALLSSEAENASTMKAAIQRELGILGILISEADITITDDTAPFAPPEGVGYKKVAITGLGVKHFYTVDNYNDLLILLDTPSSDSLILVDNLTHSTTDIEIPAIANGKINVFGPYAAFAMNMSKEMEGIETSPDGGYIINKPLNRMQWHLINQGHGDSALNLFGLNVIAENAPCIKAVAKKDDNTQEAFAWSIDSYPYISEITSTKISYHLEIFFGNDTVTLSSLDNNIGDVKAISVVGESNSPGYTFENKGSDVYITFLSDFYNTVTIPLNITLQNDSTISSELTINRVGVDIQAHHISSGNPEESTRNIWHGTQNGCSVDISGPNNYKVTATYYIPDFGETKPYGLYVTRKYADGSLETEIITETLNTCSTNQNLSYDIASYVFKYKEEHNNNVNAVDYLIYSGANETAAPTEISVLVLKEDPIGTSFGGVNFGSGTGVNWKK